MQHTLRSAQGTDSVPFSPTTWFREPAETMLTTGLLLSCVKEGLGKAVSSFLYVQGGAGQVQETRSNPGPCTLRRTQHQPQKVPSRATHKCPSAVSGKEFPLYRSFNTAYTKK